MKTKNSKNKELLEYKKMSALVDKTYKEVTEIVKKQNQKKQETFYFYTTN